MAVIDSVMIGIVLLVFVNKKSYVNPYIVVVTCDGANSERQVMSFLSKQVQRCTVKSKTVQEGSAELNVEIRMKGEDTSFINILSDLDGVRSAVLVSCNGDYMG